MMHENPATPHEVKMGSARQFGLVMAGFFAVLAALSWWNGGALLIVWAALFAAFMIAALAVPHWLAPLNLLWFRFGMLLHALVSPLVLGAMFFLIITPMGWLMRLLGARPLRLKFDRAAQSYWIPRDPPGPPPASLENQF